MANIISLGELLVDLTQTGADENGYGEFTAFPGGAPANVAVAASRLGADAGFIGKVGDDSFGHKLAETLEKDRVDVRGLYFDESVPTTMAIVSVDATGERTFSFYRDPGADTQLSSKEAISAMERMGVPLILHIGALSLTDEPSREACMTAVNVAWDAGALISYDPNYRAALWDSEEHAVEMMKSLLPYVDILKVSDEEMVMLTDTEDLEEGSAMLAAQGTQNDQGIRLVMVTLGADGVFVRYKGNTCRIPGYSVEVADTNGAGDTFAGAVLTKLAGRIGSGKGSPEWEDILEYVNYANKAASITCTRHGAIPAMPRAEEVVI